VSEVFVLDASALLCLLQQESGADRVAEALPHSIISAVNLSERAGLSLGDRACLALGQLRQAIVLTADIAWSSLDLDVAVEQLR
jgi:ribonuclease VapC